MPTIKDLIPYSKPLTALYVEDDIGIRENYAKVFQEIFASLDVAKDGEEGLNKFRNKPYDIIITDINMPRMNGIEMIEKIIQTHPEQMIIVTSAHDEAQYLLKLIDLGIEKFLIKPVNFEKLTSILLRACKRLIELKELREYQHRIEEENLQTAELLKEIKRKNIELEKTILKLTQNENKNITLVDGIEKEKVFTEDQLEFFSPNIDQITAMDFATHYTGNIEQLSDRLEKVEETLELNIHQKLSEPTRAGVEELTRAFAAYAHHLESTYKFKHLAHALRHLSGVISNVEDPSILKDMQAFLFGIADSLNKWREEVLVQQTAEDIHFLDNSIISDCLQTESILLGGHAEEDEGLDDLFF